MTLALIGAGQRGMIYAEYAYFKKGAQIAAIVEPHEERRKIAAEKFRVPEEFCFTCVEDFFAKGKLADALILASMDKDHYEQTMAALDCGYDILLEKPVSPDPTECLKIAKKAKELDKKIVVCHVLRYTNFFGKIKEIVDSGTLGKVIAINHSENVGNFHIAHSFVRGNWRRKDQSSPIIMQKSCHDMDILAWIVGSEAKKVASFGSLRHFKEENAPEGSAARCLDCKAADRCQYHAVKAYMPVRGGWPATLLGPDQSEEGIMKALETSPYGRCVYRCDNDVCDHMSMAMEFENGVTATFSLTAQTNSVHRHIHIMCEHGEIEGDGVRQQITVRRFAPNGCETFEERTIHIRTNGSGHGGGDAGIMEEFTNGGQSLTSISNSVESHLMAGAMEEARLTGRVVDLAEYRKSIMN